MKNLLTRRSIRRYSDRSVDDVLLERLLAEASRTQTMGNLQLYSVVVTRSDEMKQRLSPAHFGQPMVTGAPVVLTVCADFNRTTRWALCRNAQPGYDNFLSFQQIIDVLQLPRLTFPVATLTVGWPDECPAQTDRLPLRSFLHRETYTDYTPQAIDEFYTPKEQLPENQEFVAINHKQTLAQVFTDLRYTRADNEAMSAGLLQALRHQGFM